MNGLDLAVVGGGWAGCAAAVEAALRGARVTLYEAGHVLGGRAKRIEGGEAWPHPLDNGAHILIGAYRESLRLMTAVGVDPERAFMRLPLHFRSADRAGFMLVAHPRWPAPLHLAWGLLTVKGLDWAERLGIDALMRRLKRWRWEPPPTWTVADLVRETGQRARVVKLLWEPLCLAALNTAMDEADARIFATVLRDSFGAARADSDMLLPRVDLSAAFPEPAGRWLAGQGHAVHRGAPVRRLEPGGSGWRVDGLPHDAVILATQPSAASRLLADSGLEDPGLSGLAFRSITTVYLRLAAPFRLAHPLLALEEDAARGRHGQWVFDRAMLRGDGATAPGELAFVISVREQHLAMSDDALVTSLVAQLEGALRQALPPVAAARRITDRRATLAVTPGLARPVNATRRPGLHLAGDYTDTGYPSTLEGAVRSAMKAVDLALARPR